ncbi:MAG: DUF6152 family protein [Burkholderiales bacterium]
MKLRKLAALTLCLVPVLAAQAHHSDAMFDRDQVRELSGTVKEFQFTNPHTWVQLSVADANGQVVEWSLEWGSPNQLGRQGIRPSTFPAGAEVLIRTNPMRDGSPGGAFIGARFPDGSTVGRWE